jgi:hypothetical protein
MFIASEWVATIWLASIAAISFSGRVPSIAARAAFISLCPVCSCPALPPDVAREPNINRKQARHRFLVAAQMAFVTGFALAVNVRWGGAAGPSDQEREHQDE